MTDSSNGPHRRSASWLHRQGVRWLLHRASARAAGSLTYFLWGRPKVGIRDSRAKATARPMTMDVAGSVRANPFDAIVLISGGDKTIPAQLTGFQSIDWADRTQFPPSGPLSRRISGW
jgi:hypothetical protein